MKKLLFVIPLFYLIYGCSTLEVKEQKEASSNNLQKEKSTDKKLAIRTYIDGLIQSVKGNSAEAVLDFQDALQLDPNAGIYYAMAKDFLRLNKINAAIQNINKAIELDSSNLDYFLLQGQLYTISRNTDLAIETFEKVISLDSTNYQALFTIAELYEPSKPLKALKTYEKVIELIGPEWNVLIKIADLNERMGNVEKTISTVEELVKLNPTNLELKKLLIETYIKNKNFDKAISLVDETLELFPNDLNLIEYKANSLVQSGKWDEGAKSYLVLVKSKDITFENKLRVVSGFMDQADADSSLVQYMKEMLLIMDADTAQWQVKVLMATIYAKENSDSLAVKYYQDAIKLAEWNEQVMVSACGYMFDNKYYDEVIVELERGVKNFPQNFFVNLLLAYSYSQNSEHAKAIPYFEKANSIRINEISVLSAYGFSLNQLGKTDSALTILNKAIEIDSTNAQVFGMLGMIYDKNEDWEKCDAAYEKAVQLDSTDALLLNNYAYSLSERGLHLEKCLAMSKIAVEKDPENSSYLDTIGWIYYMLKDYPKAKDYIEKSLKRDGKNAVVHEHLGDVYAKMGNKKKAIEYWKKAFELDSSIKNLKEKIDKGDL